MTKTYTVKNDWSPEKLGFLLGNRLIRCNGELNEDGKYVIEVRTDDNEGTRAIKCLLQPIDDLKRERENGHEPERTSEIEPDYGDPSNTLPQRFEVQHRWKFGLCKRCMKRFDPPGVVVRIYGVGWFHDDCYRVVNPKYYRGL